MVKVDKCEDRRDKIQRSGSDAGAVTSSSGKKDDEDTSLLQTTATKDSFINRKVCI